MPGLLFVAGGDPLSLLVFRSLGLSLLLSLVRKIDFFKLILCLHLLLAALGPPSLLDHWAKLVVGLFVLLVAALPVLLLGAALVLDIGHLLEWEKLLVHRLELALLRTQESQRVQGLGRTEGRVRGRHVLGAKLVVEHFRDRE